MIIIFNGHKSNEYHYKFIQVNEDRSVEVLIV